MADIENHTGVPHFWFEQTGPAGQRLDVLVVRASFDFARDGAPITLAREQQPIVLGDSFNGPVDSDPMRAVIENDGDLLPFKPGTDVLVTGHAQAPGGLARPSWEASLRVGQTGKFLRLHGPRQFQKRWYGWRLGPAKPVTSVPLDYRLAFGGCIDIPAALLSGEQADVIKYPGNPAGCGWLPKPAALKHFGKPVRNYISKWINNQKELPAPQIEAAHASVRYPYDHLAPQGLSAIARWWAPRQAYQGSYDENWRATRYPLLPEDFDSRYYQCAHPDLVIEPHLLGDERVTLEGLLPTKQVMRLPGWRPIAVVKRASGERTISLPVLDTVRFQLDQGQASLVWRAHFECDDPVTEITLAFTTTAAESDRSQKAPGGRQ